MMVHEVEAVQHVYVDLLSLRGLSVDIPKSNNQNLNLLAV